MQNTGGKYQVCSVFKNLKNPEIKKYGQLATGNRKTSGFLGPTIYLVSTNSFMG